MTDTNKIKQLKEQIKSIRDNAVFECDSVRHDVMHGKANQLQAKLNKLIGKPKNWRMR